MQFNCRLIEITLTDISIGRVFPNTHTIFLFTQNETPCCMDEWVEEAEAIAVTVELTSKIIIIVGALR